MMGFNHVQNSGFHHITLVEVRLLQASWPFLETEWIRVAGSLYRICAVIRGESGRFDTAADR